jgi:two-component system nitrate/nitrite response regulator NarL
LSGDANDTTDTDRDGDGHGQDVDDFDHDPFDEELDTETRIERHEQALAEREANDGDGHDDRAAGDGQASGQPGGEDTEQGRSGLGVVIIDGDASHVGSLSDVLPDASGGRVDVLATSTKAEDGLQAVDEHDPDVVVLGLNLAGGSLELLEKLLGNGGGGKIVAVAADDVTEAAEAAALGAHAVVSRTTAPEHLLAPILGVVQGWRVLADPVVAELVSGARRPGAELLADLDDESVQLWMLVAEGLDLSTIASRMDLDEEAAKERVADLRSRVGATNRTQLAALAGRAGLVDDGWLDGSTPGS